MSMTRSENDQRHDFPEVSRRGAHRPRGNPVVSLLPLVALGVLLVCVVSLAYVLFGRGGDADGTGDPVTAASVASSASPAASQSGAPAASSASSPSGQPSSAASPAGSVDKAIVLDFYNGSSPTVPGLSRTAAAEVKKGGWQIGVIESWTGPAVTRTTVYYQDAAQLATARAVIRELGVGVAKVNSTYATNGIAVVISNDYTP
jgi:hypothetical protein